MNEKIDEAMNILRQINPDMECLDCNNCAAEGLAKEALALLESYKTEQPEVAEPQSGEPVGTREFIKRVYIWADQVMDDPKYPAKKLATEASKFKHDNGVRIQILNNTRERNRNLQHEVTLLNTKIDRLTAENKAHAERIERLEHLLSASLPYIESSNCASGLVDDVEQALKEKP
jgi:hypothetical protein